MSSLRIRERIREGKSTLSIREGICTLRIKEGINTFAHYA
jgi:hypothetical protein